MIDNDSSGSPLTLYELNHLVSEIIAIDMGQNYWVEAELADIREVHGHCYMELVQKETFTNTPVAKASAKCWANKWPVVSHKFESIARTSIEKGMNLLLLVRPNFHEAYGFSWIVMDINPEFTLGNLARRRLEILEQLRKEGVIDMQKQLPLSPFANHIAVISSAHAAGYDDFCNQLHNNGDRYCFQIQLFPAIMQGEQTERSIISALNKIFSVVNAYDAVVVIRGGGGKSDLTGFDTLMLAENIANFPIPVITGIGHNRDESVLDIVAHTSVKTPTAAAMFLVENIQHTVTFINTQCQKIESFVTDKIKNEQSLLSSLSASITADASVAMTKAMNDLRSLQDKLSFSIQKKMLKDNNKIDSYSLSVHHMVTQLLQKQWQYVQLYETRLKALSPSMLLKKGFSITYAPDGKVLKDSSQISSGDIIRTLLKNGEIHSVVK